MDSQLHEDIAEDDCPTLCFLSKCPNLASVVRRLLQLWDGSCGMSLLCINRKRSFWEGLFSKILFMSLISFPTGSFWRKAAAHTKSSQIAVFVSSILSREDEGWLGILCEIQGQGLSAGRTQLPNAIWETIVFRISSDESLVSRLTRRPWWFMMDSSTGLCFPLKPMNRSPKGLFVWSTFMCCTWRQQWRRNACNEANTQQHNCVLIL